MTKVNFKGKSHTKSEYLANRVWYKCTSAWGHGNENRPFLVNRCDKNSFFIIHNDGSATLVDRDSCLFAVNFSAEEVQLEINVL